MRLPSISLKPMPDARRAAMATWCERAAGASAFSSRRRTVEKERSLARAISIIDQSRSAPRAQVVPLRGLFQAGAGRVRNREAAGLGGLRDAAPFRDPPLRAQHRG